LVTTLLLLAESDEAALHQACGAEPSIICQGTWNLTHNEVLARSIEWIIARPVAAIIVTVIATVLSRWARKGVTAAIDHFIAGRELAGRALGKIGVDTKDDLVPRDPRDVVRASTLSTVARGVVSAIIWSIAILIILGLFNINLAPLIAGAGIAGIALGFGAQTLVKDCIAGFFMLLDDQCGVGDSVDLGPTLASGTVESINLRMTRVRGADGTLWCVPNGTIMRVGNLSRNWSLGTLDITLPPQVDVDAAIDAVRKAVEDASKQPDIAEVLLEQPRFMGVDRLDTTGVTVRMSVKTKPGEHWAVLRELRLAVSRLLAERGIHLYGPVAGNGPT
jgi:moderate conductance mechanosensitive channel